jgi:hypothetical protein
MNTTKAPWLAPDEGVRVHAATIRAGIHWIIERLPAG